MQKMGKRERIVQVAAAPGEPFDNGEFQIVVEDIPKKRPLESVVGAV
jgi:hypothetical protein